MYVNSKSTLAVIYLDNLDIETSDGKGIGKPRLTVKAIRADPNPRFSPWYEAEISSFKSSKRLFAIENLSYFTNPSTTGFNIKFLFDLYEDDPTYPDEIQFEHTYLIPYKPKELIYTGEFQISNSADFNEGAARKTVHATFDFSLRYEVVNGVNSIEFFLYLLRHSINNAASSLPDVTPEMIASILYDEILHDDIFDKLQNWSSELSLTDNSFMKSFGRFLTSTFALGDPIDKVSIGIAQMEVKTFKRLVQKKYLRPPTGWRQDQTDASIKFLLNPEKAPYAVGAELQRIIDVWKAGEVHISKKYPVLLYLYTVGETTGKGVNPNPQPDPDGAGVRKASYMPRLKEILK